MTEKTSFLRPFATLISILFHPVFLVPLMAAYLIYGQPSLYVGLPEHRKNLDLVSIILNASFYPLFTVLLARMLGFIGSIQLKDQKDRIIPYIATLTWYFWTWRVVNYWSETPAPLVAMVFGAFLATSAGLVLNSFLKISMHAIGVGGLVMFMLLLGWQGAPGIGGPLALSILIAGAVLTARELISDHTPRELSLGLIIGLASQLAAATFFH